MVAQSNLSAPLHVLQLLRCKVHNGALCVHTHVLNSMQYLVLLIMNIGSMCVLASATCSSSGSPVRSVPLSKYINNLKYSLRMCCAQVAKSLQANERQRAAPEASI